jgi:hypothetical protein
MNEEERSCVFCGHVPLTREHVFPQWVVPLLETLGQPRSATRITDHDEHVHDIWNTSTIDFKARKVCGDCNSGWMSSLETAVMPILTPLVLTTAPQTFTQEEAVTLATWVAKTALTASLLHADKTNPIPKKYFDELYRERRPFRDSVVWIAAYDVGHYPASSSMVPIPPVNGFRVTGNVGCFAYQLTSGDNMADGGLVLPPAELMPYITQIWPVEPRPELAAHIKQFWPALGHLERLDVAMNDEELRYLSQVPDHSWGIKGTGGIERPRRAAHRGRLQALVGRIFGGRV